MVTEPGGRRLCRASRRGVSRVAFRVLAGRRSSGDAARLVEEGEASVGNGGVSVKGFAVSPAVSVDDVEVNAAGDGLRLLVGQRVCDDERQNVAARRDAG